MLKKIRVGIFGGTFNPIHFGHLILAQNAAEFCNLDKVLFIPSGVSYFKDPETIACAEDRLNMVSAAIADNPLFEVSTIETERSGNSYTYETIESLKRDHPDYDLFYIIGADTLFSMEKWKYPDIIFDNVRIVCAPRNNCSSDMLNKQQTYLKEKFNADIIIMDYPEIEISSSFIRNIIKENKTAKYYLSEGVREYIVNHNLYR